MQEVMAISEMKTLQEAARIENNSLTERQKQILKYLVEGLSNKQIAYKLSLSIKTVDTHRSNIMKKLQIHTLPGLVKYAIKSGLTTID